MIRPAIVAATIAAVLATPGVARAEQTGQQTVGVTQYDPAAYWGYTLFAPFQSTETYLVDMLGQEINTWSSTFRPGGAVYLLNNGGLVRLAASGVGPGGTAGKIEVFTWEGVRTWNYDYPLSHHDVAFTPDGTILILAWEIKSFEESVQAGRHPDTMSENELWPEHIVEVLPTGPTTGDIVWEWHLWDHLIQDFDDTKDNFGVVSEHPEKVNLNFTPVDIADWIHANGLDYNAELDQILITVPRFGEIWIIDHSTTTEEAAGSTGGNSGKGGDLLYRWGNPIAYNSGTLGDWRLFFQHDARWIPGYAPGAGNIMIFNNGLGRPEGDFSSVEEIVPPVDVDGNYSRAPGAAFGPAEPVWTYTADPVGDFWSLFISGAHRLDDGSTFICEGKSGRFFNVMPDGTIVWEYINPITADGPMIQEQTLPLFPPTPDPTTTENFTFRATKIPPWHPGLAGQDLTPGDVLERPACRTDTDCDGDTSFVDLTAMLGAWGPCAGCPYDFDQDGVVGFVDLTMLLGAWGPCP